MNSIKKLLLILLFSLVAIGCGSSNNTSNGTFNASGGLSSTAAVKNLVAIQITPDGPAIAKGTSVQFTATGLFSDGSSVTLENVTWTTSDQTIAVISGVGRASGLLPGRVTVTATSGSISATTALTVTAAALIEVTANPPIAQVARGVSLQYSLIGNFSDGTTQDLTSLASWSSSAVNIVNISPTGLATAVNVGFVQITGSYGGFSSAASLNVTNASVLSISLSPVGPAIANGTTKQFEAIATLSDGTVENINSSVAWASSNAAVATIASGGIDPGLATGVGPGSTIITATFTSASGGNVVASTPLTVTPAVIVSLAVTPANGTLAVGTGEFFQATGTFSDSSTQDVSTLVTWTSNDTAIATVSNVFPTKGLVNATGLGNATITAVYPGGVFATANVTTTNATLASVSLAPTNTSTDLNNVPLGSPVSFTLTGTFSDGSTQDVSTSATFVSTPAGYTNGNVFSSLNPGFYTITATDGAFNSTLSLTVVSPPGTGPLVFTGYQDGTVRAQSLNPNTGALTALTGYPVVVENTVTFGFTGPVASIASANTYSAVYPLEFASGNISVVELPIDFNGNTTTATNGTTSVANGAVCRDLAFAGDNFLVYDSGVPNFVAAFAVVPDGTLVAGVNNPFPVNVGEAFTALAGSTNAPYFFVAGTTQVHSFSGVTFSDVSDSSVVADKLAVDPSGRILAASDSATGSLTVLAVGPDGTFVATSTTATAAPVTKLRVSPDASAVIALEGGSNQFEIFPVSSTGVLSNAATPTATGNGPVDVDFDGTGNFLLVANGTDGTVSTWAFSAGTITTVGGSPFTVGAGITSMKVFR